MDRLPGLADVQHRRQCYHDRRCAHGAGVVTESVAVTVTAELAAERADRALAALLDVSRSEARRLLESGCVSSDGREVAVSERLRAGLELVVERRPVPSLEPEDIDFTVVYEDEYLAVVDKPAGILTHPARPGHGGSLANGLLARFGDIRGVGQEGRWGLVHRLDRDTSGAIVIGLTEDAYLGLADQIRRREVERDYLALVAGRPNSARGTIDAPIGAHADRPPLRAVRPDGKPARTHYRRLAWWSDPDVSLLAVKLETGRTHQIRVHLASIGHSVVADRSYGGHSLEGDREGRVWLHAARLRFVHPITGAPVLATAPLAGDLEASLAKLGEPDEGSAATDDDVWLNLGSKEAGHR